MGSSEGAFQHRDHKQQEWGTEVGRASLGLEGEFHCERRPSWVAWDFPCDVKGDPEEKEFIS